MDLSGTELQIQGVSDACSDLTATLLTETTTAVTVRLILTDKPTVGVCDSLAAAVPLTVELTQPLGARTIILTQLNR
ncbi:MAG: hypothetical protein ABI181_08205 [Mycobacteriaceae bacterium]